MPAGLDTRYCELTGEAFDLSAEEIEIFRSFDLPIPSITPEERYRKQLSFVNEEKFFWRTCDATTQQIYSVFPEEACFPVVSTDWWWGDTWDALEYGIEFDPRQPFIDQLFRLWSSVPRPAFTARNTTRSPAIHNVREVSNSFLVFNSQHVDQCYHSVGLSSCNSCADCYFVSSSEYCYECVHCTRCRLLRWSEYCRNCEDSWFLSNCTDCKNCLFCANLEGKEYYIFNEHVGKERFEQELAQSQFTARPMLENAKETFRQFLADKPLPHIISDSPQGNSGNYLRSCNNTRQSFDCSDCDDVMHCHSLSGAENCLLGLGYGDGLSNAAQFVSVGSGASNIINCVECWNNVSNLSYCSYCENSSNLFACVGLRGKEYCVFNKQLKKDEYETFLKNTTNHLKRQKIWGSFFPPNFSGLSYNQSSANEHMPLSKIPAQMMGYTWDESDEYIRPSELLGVAGDNPEQAFSEVPSVLAEFDIERDSKAVFICELSGKPYRISREEWSFYQQMQVAPAARCFEQRHRERVMQLTPKKLYLRSSSEGGESFLTAFPPTSKRTVLSYTEWDEKVLR